jgi:hypothetical protein
MDATAVRASAPAVTPATSTTASTTTNGPSSRVPTIGGGPTPAPAQPTLLGVTLLPAPAGQPQTIHLADGSMLVPLARVSHSSAAPAPSAISVAPAPAPAPAPAAVPAADFTPKGFLYRGNYYKRFQDETAIDLANLDQVEDKVTRGTLDHVKEDEPGMNGFGVTNIATRRVDRTADADLLNVNPHAVYVVDVSGVSGTGDSRSIPSVVNDDGSVYVDPRIRTG